MVLNKSIKLRQLYSNYGFCNLQKCKTQLWIVSSKVRDNVDATVGAVTPVDNACGDGFNCQCPGAVWLLSDHVPSCPNCHQALCLVVVVFAFFFSQVLLYNAKQTSVNVSFSSLFITLPNQFVCLMYGFILAAAYLTATQSTTALGDVAYVFVNLEVCSIISPWLTRAELCLVPLLVCTFY